MIQKIKNFILISGASATMLVAGFALPMVAHAAISENLCSGSQAASGETAGCPSTGDGANVESGLSALANTVTDWFTIIVGALSVIMIIYGGFRYITSGGDSGKVGNAKNTIIYAIIGLIIVALAQIIVNVVVGQADNAGTDFTTAP